jgi:hypothetical protein
MGAGGQVLLATLLFCFIVCVLFAGLYKAGRIYGHKEFSRRGSDLTSLSAGAVYSNGLEMVRYTNVALMAAFSIDATKMALAAMPLIETPPLAIEAALKADKVNFRSKVQTIQSYAFGVDLPPSVPVGAYPLLIELEGHRIAGENGLRNDPLWPLFFYNTETARGLHRALRPDMNLRFRTAADLLPEAPQDLYSLLDNGQRHYFTQDQVEPAHNPRHPDQMRVRQDLPPYGGMWVRRETAGTGSGTDLSKVFGHHEMVLWIFSHLRSLLSKVKLDLTHRTDPANHTLTLLLRSPGVKGRQDRELTDISSATLEGGGLAAWDIGQGPFRVHLQKKYPLDLPSLGELTEQRPVWSQR